MPLGGFRTRAHRDSTRSAWRPARVVQSLVHTSVTYVCSTPQSAGSGLPSTSSTPHCRPPSRRRQGRQGGDPPASEGVSREPVAAATRCWSEKMRESVWTGGGMEAERRPSGEHLVWIRRVVQVLAEPLCDPPRLFVICSCTDVFFEKMESSHFPKSCFLAWDLEVIGGGSRKGTGPNLNMCILYLND
jgi:hypothetical protein